MEWLSLMSDVWGVSNSVGIGEIASCFTCEGGGWWWCEGVTGSVNSL